MTKPASKKAKAWAKTNFPDGTCADETVYSDIDMGMGQQYAAAAGYDAGRAATIEEVLAVVREMHDTEWFSESACDELVRRLEAVR